MDRTKKKMIAIKRLTDIDIDVDALIFDEYLLMLCVVS
jgi:hypothetical protein